eukprot:gene26671-4249_t
MVNDSHPPIKGVRVLSGTSNAPTLAFLNDTDTGIYNVSTNNIGIVTGGVKRVTVDSEGLSVNGTLTDPPRRVRPPLRSSSPTQHVLLAPEDLAHFSLPSVWHRSRVKPCAARLRIRYTAAFVGISWMKQAGAWLGMRVLVYGAGNAHAETGGQSP